MIRPCTEIDSDTIRSVINQGAQAYKGVTPSDRWHEPYMSSDALRRELQESVVFWGWEASGTLTAVMGMQHVRDATLIRHASVLSTCHNQGIGTTLLTHLCSLTGMPILVGTWAAASWAARFYQRHGFVLVDPETRQRLLETYWRVPDRQVETSVVLADQRWRHSL